MELWYGKYMCMEYLYGNPSLSSLGRKNLNQSVFLGCLKFVLWLVCFWLNDFG